MTDYWSKAPPGRDIDRAVGWFVGGWTEFPWSWKPSTNNLDALEALRLVMQRWKFCKVNIRVCGNGYTVTVAPTYGGMMHASTLGLAACRAIMYAASFLDNDADGKPPTLAARG